jgi:hypothetical protein
MDNLAPPRLEDCASLAEWKQARADFFARPRQRRREVVEKIVEVPVEVERIVHVEVEKRVEVPVEVLREVEVVRTEYVDRYIDPPAQVEVPDFLRYDPLSEFLANEAAPGETDEATLDRLRAEIADLFALQRGDRLSESEDDRLRYLTSHIKAMGE